MRITIGFGHWLRILHTPDRQQRRSQNIVFSCFATIKQKQKQEQQQKQQPQRQWQTLLIESL